MRGVLRLARAGRARGAAHRLARLGQLLGRGPGAVALAARLALGAGRERLGAARRVRLALRRHRSERGLLGPSALELVERLLRGRRAAAERALRALGGGLGEGRGPCARLGVCGPRGLGGGLRLPSLRLARALLRGAGALERLRGRTRRFASRALAGRLRLERLGRARPRVRRPPLRLACRFAQRFRRFLERAGGRLGGRLAGLRGAQPLGSGLERLGAASRRRVVGRARVAPLLRRRALEVLRRFAQGFRAIGEAGGLRGLVERARGAAQALRPAGGRAGGFERRLRRLERGAVLGRPGLEHRAVAALLLEQARQLGLQVLELEAAARARLALVGLERLALLALCGRDALEQRGLRLRGGVALERRRVLAQLGLAGGDVRQTGLERGDLLEPLLETLEVLALEQDREQPLERGDDLLLLLEGLDRAAALEALAGAVHQLLDGPRAGLFEALVEELQPGPQELDRALASLALEPRQQALHRAAQALELALEQLLLVGDARELAAVLGRGGGGRDRRGRGDLGRERERGGGRERATREGGSSKRAHVTCLRTCSSCGRRPRAVD